MSISQQHISRTVLHRETFLNEESVRSNPYHKGVPTSLTFGATRGLNYGIFDGTTQINTGSKWIGKKPCTIAFWINRTSSTGRVVGSVGNGYVTLAANEISFSRNGAQLITTTGSKVPNSTWHRIVCVSDGIDASTASAIYIDGSLAISGNVATAYGVEAENIVIGNVVAGNNGMSGFLAGLVIDNSQWTVSQIANDYNNSTFRFLSNGTTTQVVGSNLIAGWDFTSGWTTVDMTINSATSIITTAADGRIYKNLGLVAGGRYSLIISGTNSGGTMRINDNGDAVNYGTLNGAFTNQVINFTSKNTGIEFKSFSNGSTVTITSMTIQPITQESGGILFNIDSGQGVIRDKTGLRTITNTATTVVQNGTNYVMNFNGSSSLLTLDTEAVGAGDITFSGWLYIRGVGQTAGRIIDNGRFLMLISNNTVQAGSAGSAAIGSAASSIQYSSGWYYVAYTRTANGNGNFYIGTKSTAVALSGTANQASGTPVGGTNNAIIGNQNGGGRALDCLMKNVTIYSKILTLAEITQIWSSTKGGI